MDMRQDACRLRLLPDQEPCHLPMHQYATDDEAAYQRNNEIDSGVNIRVNLSIQPIDHEVDDLLMEEVHGH